MCRLYYTQSQTCRLSYTYKTRQEGIVKTCGQSHMRTRISRPFKRVKIIHKRNLALLNKSIIALIEKGDDASVLIIDMRVKNSIKTIGNIQDELILVDCGSVQEQFDEVIALISELEDNVAML